MENNDFGKILKRLRKESNLTQEQLGKLIGKSKTVISYYELQERCPSPNTIKKLVKVFRVSSDYLLGIDNTENEVDVSDLTEKYKCFVKEIINYLRLKNKEKGE